MAIVFDKDKVYMETLKAFRCLIDSEYQAGGWLPPSREMCERLKVSSVTYVKVTNRLVAESIAENFQRKGIYIVPEKYRAKKIGIVVGNGEESPYLGSEGLFTTILQSIDKTELVPHLIQASPVSNIPRSAMSHYVSGLIWIPPNNGAFPVIRDFQNTKLIPVVAISITPSNKNGTPLDEIVCITEDYHAMGSKIADLFIKKQHKNIIYVGDSWFAELCGLTSCLSAAGIPFDSSHCLGNHDPKAGQLTELINRHKTSGLIIEGRERRLETIFQELSALPGDKQFEVLIRDGLLINNLIKKYPKIKLLGIAHRDIKKCGVAAVEMLVNHLNTGEKMRSTQLSTFTIKE